MRKISVPFRDLTFPTPTLAIRISDTDDWYKVCVCALKQSINKLILLLFLRWWCKSVVCWLCCAGQWPGLVIVQTIGGLLYKDNTGGDTARCGSGLYNTHYKYYNSRRTFAKMEVSQSRRRPLLGPSPDWKCRLAAKHSKIITLLNSLQTMVSSSNKYNKTYCILCNIINVQWKHWGGCCCWSVQCSKADRLL